MGLGCRKHSVACHEKGCLIQGLCMLKEMGMFLLRRGSYTGGTLTKVGQMGISSYASQLNYKITLLRPFVAAETPLSSTESKLISLKCLLRKYKGVVIVVVDCFLIVHIHTAEDTYTVSWDFLNFSPRYNNGGINLLAQTRLWLWCVVYLWLTYSPVCTWCSYSHVEKSSNVTLKINPDSDKMTIFNIPSMLCFLHHFFFCSRLQGFPFLYFNVSWTEKGTMFVDELWA